MDTTEKLWLIFGVPLIITFVVIATMQVRFRINHPCISSHVERRWHPPYTTFMYIGKVMFPQSHPGYYANDNICDRRK